MIKRIVVTGATLAVLTFGAMIALEAVGLLFQGGTPEPKIASLHSTGDLQAMLPPWQPERRLGEPPGQAEQDRQRREAEYEETARQAQDEERNLQDAHRWAERYRRKILQRLAVLTVPSEATRQADRSGPRLLVQEPTLVAKLGAPRPEGSQPADRMKVPVTLLPERRNAGARLVRQPPVRPNQAKVSRGGDDSACPLLSWVRAVMQPAPQAAALARRRTT